MTREEASNQQRDDVLSANGIEDAVTRTCVDFSLPIVGESESDQLDRVLEIPLDRDEAVVSPASISPVSSSSDDDHAPTITTRPEKDNWVQCGNCQKWRFMTTIWGEFQKHFRDVKDQRRKSKQATVVHCNMFDDGKKNCDSACDYCGWTRRPCRCSLREMVDSNFAGAEKGRKGKRRRESTGSQSRTVRKKKK
jgi:hypothetical protein